MPLSTTYSSFIQALNVMNAALERHRDSSMFRPLLSLAENDRAEDFVVAIVESDDALTPHDHVTIRLRDGTFVLVTHGKTIDEIAWRVSERYLNDVATHPRWYIDNPGRLDFDWLKLRMGVLPRKTTGSIRGDRSGKQR